MRQPMWMRHLYASARLAADRIGRKLYFLDRGWRTARSIGRPRAAVTPALFSRQISSLTQIDPGESEFIYLFHLGRPSFLSGRLRVRSARPFIIAAREMRRRNSSRSGTRALSISLSLFLSLSLSLSLSLALCLLARRFV